MGTSGDRLSFNCPTISIFVISIVNHSYKCNRNFVKKLTGNHIIRFRALVGGLKCYVRMICFQYEKAK